MPSLLAAPGIAVVVAIATDLVAEWQARKTSGPLVPVWRSHWVPDADYAQSLLAEERIPCVLRGVHHRVLTRFFAPYVPIDVLVPECRAEEALVHLRAGMPKEPPRPPRRRRRR